MERGVEDRHIHEFFARLDTTQHQATSAHITTSNEVCGEQQALAKNLKQGSHVFRSRNTAEKNHLTRILQHLRERVTVAAKRIAVFWVAGIDIVRGNLAHPIERNQRVWWK